MSNWRIIQGDCLEVLPTLEAESVDAVITDPPYPNLKGGLKHSSGNVCSVTHPTVTVGTPWGHSLEALHDFPRIARLGALSFCSYHAIGEMRSALHGKVVGLVTWHKRNTTPSFRNRPHYTCEYVWLIEYDAGLNWKTLETMYDIPKLAAGCFATERILQEGSGKAAHPAQKPVALMLELVQVVPVGGTVLDPFMGTGSTGVACVKTGRNFIGIEIDEGYCGIAEKRIREAAMQPRML